ncbi:hypothetical protein BKA65DRAFT_71178 [Rhexocercosporidium sp. MPI-PUGE-AT-0058]|nr:hypothetical protein BKA65DRAFT_71178 [Rhexocercosporidium sp. MPI-PUGE-AT-0058]
MDPLSITASIIAVSQAANAIVAICYDFRAAMKDAPTALSRITSSVNDLRMVLSRLEQFSNNIELGSTGTEAAEYSALRELCGNGGGLKQCLDDLISLEDKLVPASWAGETGSRRRALIQSVGWHFKEKDVEKTMRILDGHKSTLQMAILVDQMGSIAYMSKAIRVVDQNTKTIHQKLQDASLNERERSIFRWLSPVNASSIHEAALLAHQKGTNEWFLSSKKFKDWIESDCSILWISGFPGSGKTILMSTVIQFLQRLRSEEPGAIVAYFYCDFRTPEARDALNLLGSIISQICLSLGSFPAELEDAFDSKKTTASSYSKQSGLETLFNILHSLTSTYQVIIVVDALDECEGSFDILRILKRLVHTAIDLKILFSSRDEVDIREQMTEYPRLRLEDVSTHLALDIDRYVDFRLTYDSNFRWLKPSFKQDIQKTLSSKAKGMFRWTQCQLDEIGKLRTMKDIRMALNNLPTGLHETYEKILAKISTGNVRLVKQILQWLVCDVSTLSLRDLHEALAIEPGLDHIDEESQLSSEMDILDMCGSLVTVTASEDVVLAHLSVKDYLLSSTIKSGQGSEFSLSSQEANAECAKLCLAYLNFTEFRTGPASGSSEFEARLLQYPFINYASFRWASYVRNCPQSSEVEALVVKFFSPSSRPQFMSWLQLICSEIKFLRKDEYKANVKKQKLGWNHFPPQATSLYYAASFGLESIVKALLGQGHEIDAPGGRLGATAFHAAVLRGHIKVMELLYQNGADPNKADIIKKTPLHSAVDTGDAEVVRYLLDIGADTGVLDKNLMTPYQTCCNQERGHDEVEVRKVFEDFLHRNDPK